MESYLSNYQRLLANNVLLTDIRNNLYRVRGMLMKKRDSMFANILIFYSFDNWKTPHCCDAYETRLVHGGFHLYRFNIKWGRAKRHMSFLIGHTFEGQLQIDDNGGEFYKLRRNKCQYDDIVRRYRVRQGEYADRVSVEKFVEYLWQDEGLSTDSSVADEPVCLEEHGGMGTLEFNNFGVPFVPPKKRKVDVDVDWSYAFDDDCWNCWIVSTVLPKYYEIEIDDGLGSSITKSIDEIDSSVSAYDSDLETCSIATNELSLDSLEDYMEYNQPMSKPRYYFALSAINKKGQKYLQDSIDYNNAHSKQLPTSELCKNEGSLVASPRVKENSREVSVEDSMEDYLEYNQTSSYYFASTTINNPGDKFLEDCLKYSSRPSQELTISKVKDQNSGCSVNSHSINNNLQQYLDNPDFIMEQKEMVTFYETARKSPDYFDDEKAFQEYIERPEVVEEQSAIMSYFNCESRSFQHEEYGDGLFEPLPIQQDSDKPCTSGVRMVHVPEEPENDGLTPYQRGQKHERRAVVDYFLSAILNRICEDEEESDTQADSCALLQSPEQALAEIDSSVFENVDDSLKGTTCLKMELSGALSSTVLQGENTHASSSASLKSEMAKHQEKEIVRHTQPEASVTGQLQEAKAVATSVFYDIVNEACKLATSVPLVNQVNAHASRSATRKCEMTKHQVEEIVTCIQSEESNKGQLLQDEAYPIECTAPGEVYEIAEAVLCDITSNNIPTTDNSIHVTSSSIGLNSDVSSIQGSRLLFDDSDSVEYTAPDDAYEEAETVLCDIVNETCRLVNNPAGTSNITSPADNAMKVASSSFVFRADISSMQGSRLTLDDADLVEFTSPDEPYEVAEAVLCDIVNETCRLVDIAAVTSNITSAADNSIRVASPSMVSRRDLSSIQGSRLIHDSADPVEGTSLGEAYEVAEAVVRDIISETCLLVDKPTSTSSLISLSCNSIDAAPRVSDEAFADEKNSTLLKNQAEPVIDSILGDIVYEACRWASKSCTMSSVLSRQDSQTSKPMQRQSSKVCQSVGVEKSSAFVSITPSDERALPKGLNGGQMAATTGILIATSEEGTRDVVAPQRKRTTKLSKFKKILRSISKPFRKFWKCS